MNWKQLIYFSMSTILMAIEASRAESTIGSDPAEIIEVDATQAFKIDLNHWLATDGLYENVASSRRRQAVKLPHLGPFDGLDTQEFGAITLRKTIRSKTTGNLALYIAEPIGALRVLIDGRPQPGFSKPHPEASKHYLARGNHFHEFPMVAGQNVEIAMELANHKSINGMAFLEAPFLGDVPSLRRISHLRIGLDQFMCGALLIIGIYHFALFLMRPEDKINIYFSIFCVSVAVRSAFAGDGRYFAEVFPEFSGVWSWKLELTVLYVCFPACLFFVRELFPDDFGTILSRFILICGLIGAPISFIADLKIGWTLLAFYQAILVVCVLAAEYIGIKVFVKNRKDAKLFFLSGLFIVVAVINDILQALGVIDSPKLVTFGILSFIFSNSLLMSRRFSEAFRLVEIREREIRSMNTNLEKRIEEQTQDIKSILQDIKQGVLTITSSENYTIGKDYSPFLVELFNSDQTELAGQNGIDFIFENSNLSSNQISMIKSSIDFSLGQFEFNWAANEKNLVREFNRIEQDGSTKIFEIDWNPVVRQEIIEKVLITIRDVTSLRHLQSTSEQTKEEMAVISEIINIPQHRFSDCINQSMNVINENRRLLEAATDYNHEVVKIMFINYHTLKATCRSRNLKSLAELVHEIEHPLAAIYQKQDMAWDRDKLVADLDRIEELVKKFIYLNEHRLGRRLDDHNSKRISLEALKEQINVLQSIDPTCLSGENRDKFLLVKNSIKSMCHTSGLELFGDILDILPKLAKDLGKDEPRVAIADSDILLDNYHEKLIKKIFPHIIRNSLDHGIEFPQERVANSKSSAGLITITIEEQDDFITIRYEDDGRGLNLERLREKAIDLNIDGYRDFDELAIANLIFESGLSTADGITQISGRGVGMGAVRQLLEENNGSITIKLKNETTGSELRPFYFDIRMPKYLPSAAVA